MAPANGKRQTPRVVLDTAIENQVAETRKNDGVRLCALDCRGAA